MTLVLDFLTSLFAQPTFVLVVATMSAVGVAYVFAWYFENWMHGAVLFPALLLGALTAAYLGRTAGLIYGRDQDIQILLACVLGVGATLPVLLVASDVVRWLASYDRRRFREMLNRNQPQG